MASAGVGCRLGMGVIRFIAVGQEKHAILANIKVQRFALLWAVLNNPVGGIPGTCQARTAAIALRNREFVMRMLFHVGFIARDRSFPIAFLAILSIIVRPIALATVTPFAVQATFMAPQAWPGTNVVQSFQHPINVISVNAHVIRFPRACPGLAG